MDVEGLYDTETDDLESSCDDFSSRGGQVACGHRCSSEDVTTNH